MKRRLDDITTPGEPVFKSSRSVSPVPVSSCSIIPISNVVGGLDYSTEQVTSSAFNYTDAIMPVLTNSERSIFGMSVSSSRVGGVQRGKSHSVSALSVGQNSQPPHFQRLKVEDALSYLDQVKYKFASEPHIYDEFLDIMKEFKAQSIDTPGVITRVSFLFRGYPELISGFNTFLPPGYKIEVQSDDAGYSVQVSVSSNLSTSANLIPPQTVHYATPPTSTTTTSIAASGLVGGNATSAFSAKSYCPISNTINAANSLTSLVNNTAAEMNNTFHKTPAASSSFNRQSQRSSTQALVNVDGGIAAQPIHQSQPVEFNHAINYVNKIKLRFQEQPDKYKKFLEILHTYQKEQRVTKENYQSSNFVERTLTEAQVYSQVAKLFENQEDLLAEFGQFLPDATSHYNSYTLKNNNNDFFQVSRKQSFSGVKNNTYNNAVVNNSNHSNFVGSNGVAANCSSKYLSSVVNNSYFSSSSTTQLKRSSSFSSNHSDTSVHVSKKCKLRSVPLAEVNTYCNLSDLALFDRIRKCVGNQEIYENFLKCLYLYNLEIAGKPELLTTASSFLLPFPDVFNWFKDFIGCSGTYPQLNSPHGSDAAVDDTTSIPAPEPYRVEDEEVTSSDGKEDTYVDYDNTIEIDYSTCRKIGASYCAVPDDFIAPKCSGRTELCKQILNDTYISFPVWSEDSTFVSSKKTQYEEYMYRCEDERFELDLIIEINAAAIRVFENVQRMIARLSVEEASRFVLDDCLGGTSCVTQQKAIRRIYGEKATDIIEGLKKNPAAAIPVVLKRLKTKDTEWREAQKGFNRIWREHHEKYYLKSLDHQGMNFKQTDTKYIRSKSLMNEIETLFSERQKDTIKDGENDENHDPHLVLPYKSKNILNDAANLLIHHVKRQTSIQKDDKHKIKCLLKQFIPDLFYHPRQELSEDERDEDTDEEVNEDEDKIEKKDKRENEPKIEESKEQPSAPDIDNKEVESEDIIDLTILGEDTDTSNTQQDMKVCLSTVTTVPNEHYTLFFGDSHWYLFIRLHQILCDRLATMYEKANRLATEQAVQVVNDTYNNVDLEKIRVKQGVEINVEDYYPALLEMVRSLLDGNMDAQNYEDTLREIYGIHAYVAFTLDKVVSHTVRQLQHLVSDEVCQDCYELFLKEKEKDATGGPCVTAYQRAGAEADYQKKVEALDMEYSFKILIYKNDCKVTIECLEVDTGEEDEENQDTQDSRTLETSSQGTIDSSQDPKQWDTINLENCKEKSSDSSSDPEKIIELD